MKLDQNSYYEDNRGERFSPWCSYSDMFCSLLMIFVLLFVLVLLLYVNARTNDALENERVRREFEAAQAQLQQELDGALGELDSVRSELEEAQAGLSAQTLRAQEAEALSAQLDGELSAAQQENADLSAQLDGLEKENTNQSLFLLSANKQLEQAEAAAAEFRTELADRDEKLTEARRNLANAYNHAARLEADLKVVNSGRDELKQRVSSLEADLILAQDEIAAREADIAAREEEIRIALNLSGDQEAVLSALQAELDAARADIEAEGSRYEQALAAANGEIESLNSRIEAIIAGSGEESATLSLRISELEQLLTQKEGQLAVQAEKIAGQEQAIEAVAGIRLEIISQIRAALDTEGIEARVDQETGAIVLSSELLFGVNEADLRPEGREFLSEFFPVYFDVLAHGESADSISQILVEGHTDTTGTYLSNLDLSMRRAQSVVAHCMTLLEGEDKERFTAMVTAAGCSYSNPVYARDGSVDMDRSRRVEVKFTLKDQYMIDEIRRIVEQ